MRYLRIAAGVMVALSVGAGVARADDGSWTITRNKALKGATGRIVVKLPKGTEFVMYVYRTGAATPSVGQSTGRRSP